MYRQEAEQNTAVYRPGEPLFAENAAEAPPVAADRNPLAAVTMLLGAALGVILLITALLGQSRLNVINDEANALQSEIGALREEQTDLRIRYETALDLDYTEQYAADTLGMLRPGAEQIVYSEASLPDRATVLHIRRGHALRHIWESIIDTVGECFH